MELNIDLKQLTDGQIVEGLTEYLGEFLIRLKATKLEQPKKATGKKRGPYKKKAKRGRPPKREVSSVPHPRAYKINPKVKRDPLEGIE